MAGILGWIMRWKFHLPMENLSPQRRVLRVWSERVRTPLDPKSGSEGRGRIRK